MVETRIRESPECQTYRTLECSGGPWDAERVTLEPGETEMALEHGTYTAVRVTSGQRTSEHLRWTRHD